MNICISVHVLSVTESLAPVTKLNNQLTNEGRTIFSAVFFHLKVDM